MTREDFTTAFRALFRPDVWYPWPNAIRILQHAPAFEIYTPHAVLRNADLLNLLEHGPTLPEFNVSTNPPYPCPPERQIEFDGFTAPPLRFPHYVDDPEDAIEECPTHFLTPTP